MTTRYLAPALFFFFLQALLLAVLLPNPGTRDVVLWYCNSVPIFLGFAFLFGNLQLVKGLADVGLVAQLLWVVDFLAHILFHASLFHITDYVFTSGLSPESVVTILVHTTTPFVALVWTYRIVPHRFSILYSCVYIALLYVVTLALTPAADNVNYIFRGFALLSLTPSLTRFIDSSVYVALWPVGMALLACVGYGIQTLLYRLSTSVVQANPGK